MSRPDAPPASAAPPTPAESPDRAGVVAWLVSSAGRPVRVAELRLLPAAVLAWAVGGVLVGLAPEAPIGVVAAVLWGAAACAVLGGLRVRALVVVSIALTAAALVATVVAARAPVRVPPAFVELARGAAVELDITTTSALRDGRVTGSAVPSGDAGAGAASVLLFLDGGAPELGETWRVPARLVAAEPGDTVSFLAFASGEAERVGRAPPGLAAASALRAGLLAASARLPGDGGRLLPGLAVGDTSRVDASLDAAMKASSLTHLTAVSGANCIIVTGAVFAICALFGMPRPARVLVSLAALAGFVVLVTPEPSVLRASFMGGIVLLAFALGRGARGLPALCLAVIVLLVIDPWLARSYGFALSALATAGLLLLAGPLARMLARWMSAPLALALAVPTAAQLACQPVLLLLAPVLPLWGVPANLLAGPAAPLATVVGLVACLVAPLFPPLAEGFAAIAWLPASWIAAVARLASEAPGARMPWPGGVVGVVALIALSAALLVAVLGPPGSRVRRLAAGAVCIGMLGYLGAVGGIRIASLASRPVDWQYAMCDVGQGDAMLVRSSGVVALVDTGPEPESLAACLDDLGVGHIDLLVLTHYDLDHVGGTDAVLGRVGTALVGPVAETADEQLLDRLRAGGARIVPAVAGMSGRVGALEWRALWPPPRGVELGNPASVALLVTPAPGCGVCLSALMLGDLDEAAQQRLAAAGRPPRVDVLKVAHHGSADFSESLTARAAATVGLVGVGADNGYGHPSERALAALAASGTSAFRTDLDGLILVAPAAAQGQPPRVWTAR